MSKEIYISSTPQETRLAIVEKDELAEIYYERENEYTLAGSIYNGRVTRVLPGMQSAFVDIGLERDAFLYITDFMEEQGETADFESQSSRTERGERREGRERSEGRERGEGRRRERQPAQATVTEEKPSPCRASRNLQMPAKRPAMAAGVGADAADAAVDVVTMASAPRGDPRPNQAVRTAMSRRVNRVRRVS